MNKPVFTFTKRLNSFSVQVENLEKLSVEQIKEIQDFVTARRGVFDFSSYTFTIQKRLEFNDFISLLKYANIDSTCLESTCRETLSASKSDKKIDFGKYKGMQYSEIPDVYLLWLKRNYRGADRELIDSQLKARGL
ncbi:DUF3820 family protein [bacterium]|nr:DUF3820 family protein [bacterium]MBU1990004.1 DUF3820 family protein [bacterium]